MSSRNLELALRIQANLDQALGALREFEGGLNQVDRAGKRASGGMDHATDAADKLAAAKRKVIDAHKREQAQLDELLKTYDPASTALAKLERDERKLKEAVDQGRISREQYNRALDKVKTGRDHWSEVSEGAAGAARDVRDLGDQADKTQRALNQVGRQLASGNLRGAGENLAMLGARGAAGAGVAGLAIGGLVATIGALAVAAYKGYQQGQELDRVLIASGHSAGIAAGQFEGMAYSIDQTSGQIGKGRQALLLLVQEGGAAADVLEKAGLAAVAMSELTGRSIEDTTRDVQRLMKEPSRYAAELNEQYRFLTAEIYNKVRALEAQGRTVEAQRVIIEQYASVTTERLDEVRDNLGYLEIAWGAVASIAARAWEAMTNWGRPNSAARALIQTRQELDGIAKEWREVGGIDDLNDPRVSESTRRRVSELRRQEMQYYLQAQDEELAAGAQRIAQERESAAVAAQRRQEDADAGQRTNRRQQAELQLEKDIAAMRRAGLTATSGGEDFDAFRRRRMAQIAEEFKGPKGRTPGKSDEEKQAERDARAQAQFVAQLERQAAVYGLNRQQVLEYEIAERKLTGALKERATIAAAALAEKEEAAAIKKDAELLAQVQTAYLRSIGQNAEAAERELEQRYKELLERLEKRGDEAGTAIVNKLISTEKARTALEDIARQFEQVMGNLDRREKQLGIERDAGLISTVEMQRRLLDLRKEEIAQLEKTIPLLQAQAAITSNPEQLARIENMKLRLYELQTQAGQLETAFRNSFEGGLASALEGLSTGTKGLRDAVTGLLLDTAHGMARVASQQLANLATVKLMQAITKGKGATPDLAAPDPAQAAQAGIAYAAPITSAAASLGMSAAPLTAAATALSAAAAQLAAAGAASGGGGGSSGWMSLLRSGMSLLGFAEGGHVRGPGTSTSDSIIARLSDDEYVIRAAAVRRYGVGVMDAINNMTMPATWSSAPIPRRAPRYAFADGGLVSAGAGGERQQISIRPIVAIGEEELVEAHNSPAGDRVFIAQAKRMKQSLKQILEV